MDSPPSIRLIISTDTPARRAGRNALGVVVGLLDGSAGHVIG